MKPVCHTNSGHGLPAAASLFCALVTAAGSYALAGSGGVGHVSVKQDVVVDRVGMRRI